MKRIIVLLMVLVMLVSSNVAYASEFDNPESQWNTVEVDYTYKGDFECVIPANIIAGDSFTISCARFNLMDNMALTVSLDSFYDDDLQRLYLDGDDNTYVGLALYSGDRQITQLDRVCGMLSYSGEELSLSTKVFSDGDTRAGNYHGSMRFIISCTSF